MTGSDLLFATVVIAVGLGGVGLWAGGQLSSVLSGRGWAAGTATSGVRALVSHRADPGLAWASPMPAAATYWIITASTVTVLVAAAVLVALVRFRTGGEKKDMA